MSIPKKIKIGPQSWTVIERDREVDGMLDEGNYGYTLSSTNVIVLDDRMPLSKKRAVLVHEVLHAIRLQQNPVQHPEKKAELEEWEHFFIDIWDNALLAVLRDNPGVVEWLVERDE